MGSSTPTYSKTWTGQNSTNWNDPGNWTPYGVPGDGDTIDIPAADVAAVLNGATVTLSNNVVENDGQLQLNSAGEFNDTGLIVNGAVTLEGAGVVVLSNVGSSRTNEIYSNVAGSTLDNLETIEGSGAIYGPTLTLTNATTGVIDANVSNTLAIHDITVNNDNLLESTVGALSIYNATINNGAGEILADGSGTQVDINNTTVYGGTFTTAQGGVINATSGYSDDFDGSTAAGPIVISTGSIVAVNAGATLDIEGTIENSGQIQLNSAGEFNDTALVANGAVTLEGAGAVVLSNVGSSRTNEIYSNVAGSTLDNLETIEGSGAIYGPALTLTNDTTGVIDANVSNTLAIHDITINNDNLLESTVGALSIYNATINNGAGEILADGAGTQVALNNTTVYGGDVNDGARRRHQCDIGLFR